MSINEIKCPMCKGTIFVDIATGRVVDHKSSDAPKMDLNTFIEEQKKPRAWDEKLTKAREGEAKRKAEIESKFKQAKEKPDELPNAPASPFMWD